MLGRLVTAEHCDSVMQYSEIGRKETRLLTTVNAAVRRAWREEHLLPAGPRR